MAPSGSGCVRKNAQPRMGRGVLKESVVLWSRHARPSQSPRRRRVWSPKANHAACTKPIPRRETNREGAICWAPGVTLTSHQGNMAWEKIVDLMQSATRRRHRCVYRSYPIAYRIDQLEHLPGVHGHLEHLHRPPQGLQQRSRTGRSTGSRRSRTCLAGAAWRSSARFLRSLSLRLCFSRRPVIVRCERRWSSPLVGWSGSAALDQTRLGDQAAIGVRPCPTGAAVVSSPIIESSE